VTEVAHRAPSGGVTLIALLYLHPGHGADYERFETEAARIMSRYGGRIERRVVLPVPPLSSTASVPPQPDEIHLVHFPDAESFARYRTDPELAGLAELRAAAIRDTVVWLGSDAALFRSS
jgi:hypothetical protein